MEAAVALKFTLPPTQTFNQPYPTHTITPPPPPTHTHTHSITCTNISTLISTSVTEGQRVQSLQSAPIAIGICALCIDY